MRTNERDTSPLSPFAQYVLMLVLYAWFAAMVWDVLVNILGNPPKPCAVLLAVAIAIIFTIGIHVEQPPGAEKR